MIRSRRILTATPCLASIALTNGYDSLNRRTALAALSNGTPYFIYTYAFDSASRLTNVSDGTYQADYIYLANSPLVSQIIMRSNSTVRMTTAKQYDILNRLLTISNQPSADSAISFDYVYNDANQRIRRTDSDGSYWLYRYDFLGQLTSGKHYWSDGTPVAGQQFEYAYDDIGNRTQTKAGGDANGANLQVANYAANNLNQYTEVDVPGVEDIMGIAYPTATVTINGQTASRKGEYYETELSFDNSSAILYPAFTNRAVLSGTTNVTTGNLLLPKTPQSFWYDFDGNTLSDGVWTNSWDAENRMATTENSYAVPSPAKGKESWIFDAGGRWSQRVTYSWNGSAYAPASTNRFLWDGNVLVAVVDSAKTLLLAFQRGLDISGFTAGAGASGGVIGISNATNGTHFCTSDGNGNLVALIKATGETSGIYEFDPLCGPLRVTGSAGSANPLRAGCQFTDEANGTLKYLFRDYVSRLGRWLRRDPVTDRRIPNDYCFCKNGAQLGVDRYGLQFTDGGYVTVFSTLSAYGASPPVFNIEADCVQMRGCRCDLHLRQFDLSVTSFVSLYSLAASGPGLPSHVTLMHSLLILLSTRHIIGTITKVGTIRITPVQYRNSQGLLFPAAPVTVIRPKE